jgi:ribose-phosphate pyrophosphokinase
MMPFPGKNFAGQHQAVPQQCILRRVLQSQYFTKFIYGSARKKKVEKTIIAGPNSKKLAKQTARLLKTRFSGLQTSRFPDGEIYLRFKEDIAGKHAIIINSLMPRPNESLLEMIYAIHTAKSLGARKITAVLPYLAFMRQDKRFKPGECVSSGIMAKLLSTADRVIAIDPHLHRIKKLTDIFTTKATALTADTVFADYIKKNHSRAIIVGPDIESSQWAQKIADSIGQESMILHKKRYSPTKIRTIIRGNTLRFKNREVVIVDDIISTGNTMIEPIKQLKKFGAKKITCICVHGVFVNNALQRLQKLGASVISTDTIQNTASKISVAPLIASALQQAH